MRIALTVRGHRDGTAVTADAVLDVEPASPIAEVAARLAEVLDGSDPRGADPGAADLAGAGYLAADVTVDGRRVDRDAVVGDTALRDGSVVVLDGARSTDTDIALPADYGLVPEPALLEIRAVAGPGAGRAWRLSLGTHLAGSAADCTVRWPEAPAGHVARLAVRADGTVEVTPLDAGRRYPIRPLDLVLPAIPYPDPLPGGGNPAAPAPAPAADAGPRAAFTVPVHGEFETAGTRLRLEPPAAADADVRPRGGTGTHTATGLGLDYNRPPRIVPPLPVSRHRMPVAPTKPGRRPFPMITLVAPLVMGLGMVLVFHSYFYLVFTVFSPVFAVGNMLSDRRTGRKTYRQAVATYQSTRADREAKISDAIWAERALRNHAAPDPATLGLIAAGPGARLWERRRRDADHLTVRVGTADIPALVQVDEPGVYDAAEKADWRVPAAPVSLDLADLGVTGVAGPTAQTRALARWLVLQSAVLSSPRDIQIHLLTDADAAADWDWLRWLPHARTPVGGGSFVRVGNDPETVANRVAELGGQVSARTRARGSAMSSILFADPDVLVIVDGARRMREIPGMVQILTDGPAVRVFFICLDRRESLLPQECSGVVVLDEGDSVATGTGAGSGPGATAAVTAAAVAEVTAAVRCRNTLEIPAVRADQVTAAWCATVARSLAPIRDVTSDEQGNLPDSVDLLDLIGLEPPTPERILAAWERRAASTAFVLGTGFDGPAVFDLVTDGPHALVGGTTGSGKSELLQTMVASLAVANRPDELVFVLVDYKGGSAFRDCVRLPHTLGMVTDLDDHLVERALVSLGAELRRREQVLAAVSAKDHPEYQALRARDPELAPLPRLVIVVDEFASLVREVPEFVHGMVSIAQRGRSLGLHLVLATQRPAGVVTPDIRANTNLRISLRMTDATESRDVIDNGDAVGISAATPGRALARLEHQTVIPFQTGYVGRVRAAEDPDGADTPPPPTAAAPMPWQRLGRRLPPTALPVAKPAAEAGVTDLSALVDALGAAAAKAGCEPQPSPWLDPLPGNVQLADLPQLHTIGKQVHGGRVIPVPYALDDLPARQAQQPALFNLDFDGHLYFVGSARSGRSQALRTVAGSLARAVSTADVHMYGIDAGGGALTVLEALPHCGAVVPRTDLERIERLLSRLSGELGRRQELLTRHSSANLAELRAALPPGEPRPAHLVVFVDGWENLQAAIGEYDNGRLVEEFAQLLREGATAGLHFIVSGDRALLSGKIAALNEHKFVLRMNDRSDYMLIGMSHASLPTVVQTGRGWRSDGCTESQIALLAPDPSGQAQADALRTIGEHAKTRDRDIPDELRPHAIAPLPSTVTFAEAWERVPAEQPRPLWALLGLGGDDVSPRGVDLAARGCVILGPSGSGRSTALATMAVSLVAGGTGLVVITPRDSPLRRLAGQPRVEIISTGQLLGPEITEAVARVGRPAALLIDDADLLIHTPADLVLRDLVATGRDRGIGMAAAGSGEAFMQAVIGWASELRRARTGVLIAPQSTGEGDLAGVRLPQNLVRRPVRLGRGLIGDPATGNAVSLLLPHTVLK